MTLQVTSALFLIFELFFLCFPFRNDYLDLSRITIVGLFINQFIIDTLIIILNIKVQNDKGLLTESFTKIFYISAYITLPVSWLVTFMNLSNREYFYEKEHNFDMSLIKFAYYIIISLSSIVGVIFIAILKDQNNKINVY